MKKTANELVDVERRWCVPPPRACTAPTPGAATTCWSCRRLSRSAARGEPAPDLRHPDHLIAGDRSLVSLVVHLSWPTDVVGAILVNNATWSDFWLNEGFTDYFREPDHGSGCTASRAPTCWPTWAGAICEAHRHQGRRRAADRRRHPPAPGS
ncbi:hypothetical protein ACRAWD_06050 [Caulobacter segnis]